MQVMKRVLFGLIVFLSAATSRGADDRVALTLDARRAHDATVRAIGDGVWEVETSGRDPQIFTGDLPPDFDAARHFVLSFEFFSTTGTDGVQVFVVPPASERRSVTAPGLVVSQTWSSAAIDLRPALERARGTRKPVSLRIDLGNKPRKTVQIRNVCLRAQSPQEREAEAVRAAKREELARADTGIRSYLSRAYTCRVTRVSVDDGGVTVRGSVRAGEKDAVLVELATWAEASRAREFGFETPIVGDGSGGFTVTVPRHDGGRDRLLSRWAVARKGVNGYETLSHARWADEVSARWNTPAAKPRSKKGLGGFHTGGPVSDLDELGISAVTVNVFVNAFMRSSPGSGRTAFEYGGRTWYTDDAAVGRMDRTLAEAAKRQAVVSAIILVGQAGGSADGSWAKLVAHPDADPSGTYVMPNVTTAEGVRAYAAALEFLARRYSGPPEVAKHGRIHHWIMHNEVDAGWVWTNAGEKPPAAYMDLYHRSMRMAHLIARQFDPHAKAFISLTHHWAETVSPQFYPSRDLLELLLQFSRAEGDFDWGIAHHPYPQDLFNPRTWADTQATGSVDTPKITFKNIEVLDAWVRRPEAMYLGKQVRTVHLSEQGLNSRDYSEKSLKEQAAGMAYAWNKVKNLESIEVFHYHNWIDHRGEGGLRIGLRRFPDDAEQPLGKKPVWSVYKALGTAEESAATEFAKKVIGITDWADVRSVSPPAAPK